MVKNMQAIMDRVLVRVDKVNQTTSGGIVLIDDIKITQKSGVVESIGEDVRSVQKGDKVFFHAFDDLPTIDEDIVAVRERSLLGKIEEKE